MRGDGWCPDHRSPALTEPLAAVSARHATPARDRGGGRGLDRSRGLDPGGPVAAGRRQGGGPSAGEGAADLRAVGQAAAERAEREVPRELHDEPAVVDPSGCAGVPPRDDGVVPPEGPAPCRDACRRRRVRTSADDEAEVVGAVGEADVEGKPGVVGPPLAVTPVPCRPGRQGQAGAPGAAGEGSLGKGRRGRRGGPRVMDGAARGAGGGGGGPAPGGAPAPPAAASSAAPARSAATRRGTRLRGRRPRPAGRPLRRRPRHPRFGPGTPRPGGCCARPLARRSAGARSCWTSPRAVP